MERQSSYKARIEAFGFPLVWGVMAVLLLRRFSDGSLGYPDADRILMDGVFLLDFMAAIPALVGEIFSGASPKDVVYEYTVNYFGQYPALSIGYRPPFFPFIEALFNAVFGVNMWSSRLAILAMATLGVGSWYLLMRRLYDVPTAFAATLLLVTTPFIAKWGWYTMAEWPVLAMAMFTVYLFHRYTEEQTAGWLYAAAFVFSLTCWTKQTAAFLIVWMFLYLLMQGRLWETLKRKEVWGAAVMVLVLLVPLLLITIWLGDKHMHQTVGTGKDAAMATKLSWDNLSLRFEILAKYHLTLPALVLSVAGLLWALIKKDRKAWFFILLIVVVYAVFTYIRNSNERYPIFWIPAWLTLAALPIYYLREKTALRNGLLGLVVLISAYQVQAVYSKDPNYATGYDEAAAYVLANSRSPTVFFDGYNNGYFTYYMRALDTQRSMYVLRADKLLSSSAISSRTWVEIHAHTRDDIHQLMDEYGVDFVVVEKNDLTKIAIHQELRQYLDAGPFRLEKEIPVASSRIPLQGQTLRIYRYLDAKPPVADTLELRLPVVGQTIRIPFRTPSNAPAGTSATPD